MQTILDKMYKDTMDGIAGLEAGLAKMKGETLKLDVSLKNSALYSGCEISEVAGRLNLTTPMADAVNIVGGNVYDMDLFGDEITLTGAMAIPIYLVVFHAVVHRFNKVWYDDGRGGQPVLIAQHGA